MMAKALALNGAHKVFITGRRTEVLEDAAKESPHGNIIPIPGDVTSKESLLSVAERIRSDVGYLNLLVANAGMGGPGPRISQLADRKPMSVGEYQAAAMENTYEQWDVVSHQHNWSVVQHYGLFGLVGRWEQARRI